MLPVRAHRNTYLLYKYGEKGTTFSNKFPGRPAVLLILMGLPVRDDTEVAALFGLIDGPPPRVRRGTQVDGSERGREQQDVAKLPAPTNLISSAASLQCAPSLGTTIPVGDAGQFPLNNQLVVILVRNSVAPCFAGLAPNHIFLPFRRLKMMPSVVMALATSIDGDGGKTRIKLSEGQKWPRPPASGEGFSPSRLCGEPAGDPPSFYGAFP
ncbi:hypothetical protein KSP39_PZI020990 [Platanthera zijinensis]|uniref:Uncharacterized protein n=1 Tax=Platanthera zijinensis TaxID=2320716 RepID=A0AAP0FVZ5_9ASPA